MLELPPFDPHSPLLQKGKAVKCYGSSSSQTGTEWSPPSLPKGGVRLGSGGGVLLVPMLWEHLPGLTLLFEAQNTPIELP